MVNGKQHKYYCISIHVQSGQMFGGKGRVIKKAKLISGSVGAAFDKSFTCIKKKTMMSQTAL